MAAPITDADRRNYLQTEVDADLVFVWDEAGVSLQNQYVVAQNYKTIRKFAAIGDTRAEARAAFQADIPIDPAAGAAQRAELACLLTAWQVASEMTDKEIQSRAEARNLHIPRQVTFTDRNAFVSAFERVHGRLDDRDTPSADYLSQKVEEVEQGELLASQLDEIGSKDEALTLSIQSSVDSAGRLRITRERKKSKLPTNSEELRAKLKLESNAFVMLGAKFRNRAWFQGLVPNDYQAQLCQKIASLIVTHLSGHVAAKGEIPEPSRRTPLEDQVEEETDTYKDKEPFHGLLVQAAKDNSGLPLTCRWQNRAKSFNDGGGGLNSPGRWEPSDRGNHLSKEKGAFVDKMAIMLRKFVVEKIPNIERATYTLATGHVVEPPFQAEDLARLRADWFRLVGGASSLEVVTPHQPFYFFALEETLRRMGDEDVDILTRNPGDNYVDGRMVGAGRAIPPAPLVFRPRLKAKKYDESSYQQFSSNYPSADESGSIISRQFSEEALGWMYPLSESEAKRRFGSRLRVASLAAIPKDEVTVRVIFDGAHGVQVNNEIDIRDRLEFPTPSELAKIMEVSQERGWGVVLGIAADIMKAHRRFLHAEEDHGYLGCKADSASSVIWINRVGTFGVACAALHFGRLAGAIFRMVIRILRNQPCFQLLFADDLKLVIGGPNKHVDLWTLIVGWIMVGTPFSWKKFRGGIELDYVGFWTDYGRFQLGLSEKRANWVVRVISEVEAAC